MGATDSRATHIRWGIAVAPVSRRESQRLQLSARAFHRVLKLAGAIADLAGADIIAALHIAEALQYRPRVDVGGASPAALRRTGPATLGRHKTPRERRLSGTYRTV